MFNRKQYYNEYYLQHNRMSQVNMGIPYYQGSPYPNFPAQMQSSNFQPQPPIQPYYQSNVGWNYQHSSYPYPNANPYLGGKSSVQSLFQNPLEPKDPYAQHMQMNNPMNYNPYPRPNMIPKPNGGIGNIMSSFKGQDGNFDLNKMMNTAGQMMNAVSQVSSMIKGLGGMFKV
jgi:hypothetical protein